MEKNDLTSAAPSADSRLLRLNMVLLLRLMPCSCFCRHLPARLRPGHGGICNKIRYGQKKTHLSKTHGYNTNLKYMYGCMQLHRNDMK